ncbi:MAG: PIG-L family deacetylase [Elusimicrobia bacterium]|nr:PIG-L family deacetylase [Elusimicrobiota bacterium]
MSPHLDDAVFSCGAEISRWRREGPVLVINVFTDFSNPPPKTLAPLGRESRLQEERRASKRLSFESLLLNFTESVCRNWDYGSPSRLFWGEPFGSDRPLLAKLRTLLEEMIQAISFDLLVLPLAVGWHVDHLLCHNASESFHRHPQTLFYEDRPYALIPHAVSHRIRELGGSPDSAPFLGAWAAGWDAARTVNRWAPIQKGSPAFFRWVAQGVTPIFFTRLFRKSRTRWRTEPPAWVPLPEEPMADLELWLDAIMDYRSQADAFFPDRDSLRQAFKIPCRYWKAVPSAK